MSNFTTWRSLVDGEEIGAIPDSAIYQYVFDSFTASNWPDEISEPDKVDIDSIDGLTEDSSAFGGAGGVSGDDGDSGDSAPLTEFWPNAVTEEHAIGVSIETNDSNGAISGMRDDDLPSTQIYEIAVGEGQNFSGASGHPAIGMRDGNGDSTEVDTDSFSVDDGASYHIIFNVVFDSDPVEIWINNDEKDVNTQRDNFTNDPNLIGTMNERWGFFGEFRSDPSDVVSTIDAEIREFIFYNDSLTADEIASEYNRQPFS